MPDNGSKSLRQFRTLLLIGVPYTIFYYPVDIYGVFPVVAFLAIIGAWAGMLRLVQSRNPADAAWRGKADKGCYHKAAGPLGNVVVLTALFFLLNYGTQGLLLSNFPATVLRFFIHPFMYPGILWALSRTIFIVGALAGVVVFVLVLGSRKNLRGLAAGAFWGLWALICISLLAFTIFKLGPTRGMCRRMDTPDGMRLLLSREQIAALLGLEHTLPYDAVVDESKGFAFVSLKQTRRKPGAVVQLELPSGHVKNILQTDLPDRWRFTVNEFPERMAIDTKRQLVFTLVLSPGNNHLHIASYAQHRFRLMSLVRLEAEPNSVFADEQTGRVFVFYAGAGKYGYAVYDSETFKMIREVTDFDFNGSAQHCVRDPATGNLLLTSLGRNNLIELDPRTLKVVRKLKQTNPIQGIALDSQAGRLFASAPMSHSLEIFNTAKFKKQATTRVRCGLADVAHDPDSQSVTVAGYTGAVDVLSAAPPYTLRRKLKIGHLLRNVAAGSRGRIYICSGCGVYEFTPSKIMD